MDAQIRLYHGPGMPGVDLEKLEAEQQNEERQRLIEEGILQEGEDIIPGLPGSAGIARKAWTR